MLQVSAIDVLPRILMETVSTLLLCSGVLLCFIVEIQFTPSFTKGLQRPLDVGVMVLSLGSGVCRH